MSDLKIGDELYRYVSPLGIFKYKVTGIRAYEDNNQYEVECQTCSHGYKCVLLVAENEKGALKYVSLLNYDEEDDQSYFHNCREHDIFFRTLPEAHLDCYKKLRAKKSKEIREAKDRLERIEKGFAEIESALDLAESQINSSLEREVSGG